MENAEQNNNFTQICVWEGVHLGDKTVEDFIAFMQDEFKVRVEYLETVTTLPDKDSKGRVVKDTGGRSDLLFKVHADDVAGFAVPRLAAGIRWWEDVVKYNNNAHLYTKEILKKYPPTW